MKSYLIIDGYNIINSWSTLKEIAKQSLEEAREKLITTIENYSNLKNFYFVIVFDAYNRDDRESRESFKNGEVIYTQKNQTADSYIEKLVYGLPKVYEIYVATSDYTLQRIVLGSGAIRICALELEREVEYTVNKSMSHTKKIYSHEKNNLAESLDDDTMDKLKKLRYRQQ